MILNKKVIISTVDQFDLFLQHLFQSIPSPLSFVTSPVMLFNSIIVSTKLPKMIDHLKIQSVDISSLLFTIHSIQQHQSIDYQSITSFEYQIHIQLKSPIIFYIEGGIL